MDQQYRTVPQQLPNNNLNVYDLQNVTNFTDISIRHAFIKKVYGILRVRSLFSRVNLSRNTNKCDIIDVIKVRIVFNKVENYHSMIYNNFNLIIYSF